MAPVGGMPLAPRPGVIPLRTLTVSDIFEGTMRTIRGNPGATLGLSFLVALVLTLPAVLAAVSLNQFDPGTGALRDVVQYFSTDGYSLLQNLGTLFLSGMLIVVVSEAVLGRRVAIGQAWARLKGRIWALIGVSLLTLLIALLPLIVVLLVVLGLVLAADEQGIWGLLLLLPAIPVMIFLWIKVQFAVAVTVLERLGPVTSIKRSWTLTRDQWWRIFGITLLASILLGIVSSILTIPAAAIAATTLVSNPDAQTLGLWPTLAVQASSLVVITLTSPFGAGVTSLLYIDQRIRKEALDVTLMAAAQDSGTS